MGSTARGSLERWRTIASRYRTGESSLVTVRRSGALLSLALLLQVVLGGWLLPCASEPTSHAASVAAGATHHHEAPPRDQDGRDRSACLSAPACTVVMVGAPVASVGTATRSEWHPERLVDDPVSVVLAPELPPPRG